MAVDPYAPCPCGSGKKLKFCCSDLLAEIDKVQRMLEGDQPRAALSHLEKTLAKTPGRASLLDLKATIELSLADLDAAEQTVGEYLRVDPENPSAHAQGALLAAARAPTEAEATRAAAGAAGRLQDALERVADSIPARVLQAVGGVGQALLAAGNLVAARAHLWLYQGIAGDEDTRAMELLMRLTRVSGLPLVLRDNLYLREAPAGHAAEQRHDHAQLLASRGQWRRAAALLDELVAEHADLPMLRYNTALVHGWLGDQRRLVEGLRAYAATFDARNPLLSDDAVEAEAIAQLLDEERREPPIEVARTIYKIADEEGLLDRLTRDRRVTPHQLSESELQAHEGPPPRQVMLLLDRPLPESGAGVTRETAPRIVGILSYYGRQTDREERLELVADRDEHHAQTLQLLAEVAGDALAGVEEDKAVGEAAAGEGALRSRWRFPDDTPPADRRRVFSEEQRAVLVDEWPEKPRVALGGKSPAQAAADPKLRLPLAAALLVLEQNASRADAAPGIAELRAKLGLPAGAEIAPARIDPETLPLSRVGRLDLANASDDVVFTLYKRAELCGAADVAVTLARVAVDRPGLSEDLPPQELYARLIALEPDAEDALAWIDRARESVGPADGQNATWDLMELEIRVMEGQIEEANRLVRHLRDEHLGEEGVAEQLYSLLYSLGAVPAEGGPTAGDAAPPAAVSPPPAGESKIWTPGADEPAGAAGQKLWTPT